jgi:dipeptidyl aminopeptidase/acylaminoacyl peptidase
VNEQRPFEPEDTLRIETPSDAQISPDGTRVAYTVTWNDTEKDELRSAIWLVHADGGEPRRITWGPKRDSAPRWSPDGAQIAFLSERGQDELPAQLYVMPTNGGDARRLTDIPEGASAATWSPDSSRVAFVARVGEQREPADKDERERLKRRPFEVNELKHKFDALGHFRGRRPQIFSVASDGGEPVQHTHAPYESTMPAWSPDGSRIAFVSARHDERDFDSVSDIYVVDAAGGEPRRLTPGRGPSTAPSWSPDGSRLAYAGSEHPEGGFSGRHFALWSVSADGGEPRRLSQDFNRSVGSPMPNGGMALTWSDAGRAILFTAVDRGSQHIYRVASAGGAPEKVVGGEERSVISASASRDGVRLACIVSAYDAPGQVIAVNADGSGERQLTRLNEEFLAGLRLSKPERLSFRGPDGGAFEGWLVKPLGFHPGARYPLLLDIHGGPHGAWGPGYSYANSVRQTLAGRGWATLYINPRGSGGYDEDFATYIRAGWGERDFPDFMAAVDRLVESGIADPERLAVTGVSYGGYMTNWAVGHTHRFKAAVSGACVSDLVSFYGTADVGSPFFDYQFEGTWWQQRERYERLSPISFVDQITTPLLLMHSEGDLRCPIGQSEEMFVALRRQRKPVQLIRFAGGFHGSYVSVPPSNRVEHDRRLIDWITRWALAERPHVKEMASAPAGD